MYPSHDDEPHHANLSSRLNWLRAGVLGSNDGIVSTAGLVVGVAGASTSRHAVLVAGLAGLVSGAVSMALGEYVSVSSQRDSERALLEKERRELAEDPGAELQELADLYVEKGLSTDTAQRVAQELSAKDAFLAHAEVELGIDPHALTNPWQAAVSSAVSFTLGSLLPLLAIVLPSRSWRVPVTGVVVLIALAVTGSVSARVGGSPRATSIRRVVAGGALAMLVTYAVGRLVGLTT